MRRLLVFFSLAIGACGGPSGRIVPLSPAGRIVALTAPENAQAARNAGCLSWGQNVGAGFGNLFLVGGGVEQDLTPDASGEIRIVLLALFNQSSLRFTGGAAQNGGGFLMREKPWGTLYRDVQRADDGWIDTEEAPFVVPVPVFSDFMMEIELAATRFSAKPSVDMNGLSTKQGILTGYVTRDALLGALKTIDDRCKQDMPPMICQVVDEFIGHGKPLTDALPVVLGFVSGFDAKMDKGMPGVCDPGAQRSDCNAVSVCLFADIDPVQASGPESLR